MTLQSETSDPTGTAKRYGATAGGLTVILATAGLLTYGFFALASHSLNPDDYGLVVVLWSAVFIVVSTFFRPVEQLLSRTIAELDAHEEPIGHAIRVAGSIQLGLAALFVGLAFALRPTIEGDLLDGESFLFYVMVASVVGFGISFFARGFLAGGRRFGLFALLLLVDAIARLGFALAVAIGIADGVNVVAIGIVAGPIVSLALVPIAIGSRRHDRSAAAPGPDPAEPNKPAEPRPELPEFTLAYGGGFAAAVLVVMLSEQVLLSTGPLFVRAEAGAAAAGFMFNVLMVARAPVVLFQAVAASLLPHLTVLRSTGGESSAEAFRLSVRATVLVVLSLGALTTLGVLAVGPPVMQIAFGDQFTYERIDLAIVAVGMGLYLTAATLTQAALAQGQARRAAFCWVVCAGGFIAWNLIGDLDIYRQVELGFAVSAAALSTLLYAIYRQPSPHPGDEILSGSPREIEARLAAADESV